MRSSRAEHAPIDAYLQSKVVVLILALLSVSSLHSSIPFLFSTVSALAGVLIIFSALIKAQNSPVSPFLLKMSWIFIWLAQVSFVLQSGQWSGPITAQLVLLFGLGFSVFSNQHIWTAYCISSITVLIAHSNLDTLHITFLLGLFVAFCQGVRSAMERSAQALNHAEQQDPSTGCLSRSALDSEMHRALQLRLRYGTTCTAIALEFRASEVSDLSSEALAIGALVELWQSRLRQTDLLFRLSDTRFACLLPSTSQEQAQVLLQDLERSSKAYELPVQLIFDLRLVSVDCTEVDKQSDWLEKLFRGLSH